MPETRIHPLYCRCIACAPGHPAAHEIAPSLRAALLALVAIGALAVAFAAAGALHDLLSTWSA